MPPGTNPESPSGRCTVGPNGPRSARTAVKVVLESSLGNRSVTLALPAHCAYNVNSLSFPSRCPSPPPSDTTAVRLRGWS